VLQGWLAGSDASEVSGQPGGDGQDCLQLFVYKNQEQPWHKRPQWASTSAPQHAAHQPGQESLAAAAGWEAGPPCSGFVMALISLRTRTGCRGGLSVGARGKQCTQVCMCKVESISSVQHKPLESQTASIHDRRTSLRASLTVHVWPARCVLASDLVVICRSHRRMNAMGPLDCQLCCISKPAGCGQSFCIQIFCILSHSLSSSEHAHALAPAAASAATNSVADCMGEKNALFALAALAKH
jgi:hypothetical protein